MKSWHVSILVLGVCGALTFRDSHRSQTVADELRFAALAGLIIALISTFLPTH